MKPVPSVMRKRKRYIAAKVVTRMRFTEKQVKHSIWEIMLDVLGEKGVADSEFWIMEYNYKTQECILRCNHDHLNFVLGVLTLLNDVQGKRACLRVFGVSGTLDALKDKYFKSWKKEVVSVG